MGDGATNLLRIVECAQGAGIGLVRHCAGAVAAPVPHLVAMVAACLETLVALAALMARDGATSPRRIVECAQEGGRALVRRQFACDNYFPCLVCAPVLGLLN